MSCGESTLLELNLAVAELRWKNLVNQKPAAQPQNHKTTNQTNHLSTSCSLLFIFIMVFRVALAAVAALAVVAGVVGVSEDGKALARGWGDNVEWRPWSSAIEEATAMEKPILLVGMDQHTSNTSTHSRTHLVFILFDL